MDIEIRVSAVDAQFIYVRLDDDLHSYVVQIADVEFHGLPKWALRDLYNKLGEKLGLPTQQAST